MVWLAALFEKLVLAPLLTLLGEKLVSFISAATAKIKRERAIDQNADASVTPLKNAQTGKEIDDATDSTLGGI